MSSYESKFPGVAYDPAYAQFFEQFYKISDTPDAHEAYAKQFTDDATLVMASKKVQGFSEILSLRQAMWEKVASRSHKVAKIFPFGPNSNEVMLYGTVDYGLKDGKQATVEWGARAILVKEDGTIKFGFYQVYLDTAAQSASK